MTVASVGRVVISFVYFAAIARTLGPAATGKYVFALAFTTVIVVFVDLGFTNVLVREAAKAREKIQSYFSTILAVKIFLGLGSYIAAVVIINWLGYPAETKHLVYLSAVTMLFDSLHLTLYGVLRALGNLRYEAFGIVGSQFLTLILGGIFLLWRLPLIFLILAFTLPSFLNVIYVTIVINKKYKINLTPRYDRKVFLFLGKIMVPFALAAVFARVYSYIDSILLSKLAGDAAVGLYSIPYKITYAFQFVPLALMAALYPRFSEYFSSDKSRLAYIFERGIKYLLIIIFPITVGIGVLANDIILTFFTDAYINSVLPLRILLVGLVFSYVSFPIGAFLNACNKQAVQTAIIGLVMVINIILNVILIPQSGIIGAAAAALAGNSLLAALGYIVVPKIASVSHRFLLKTFFQVSFAAVVMGAVVWYINIRHHFVFAIFIGAMVYPVMLFVTRAVTKRQLREAVIMIKR